MSEDDPLDEIGAGDFDEPVEINERRRPAGGDDLPPPPPPTKLKAAERRQRMLEEWLLSGTSLRRLGERYRVSHTQAARDLDKALEEEEARFERLMPRARVLQYMRIQRSYGYYMKDHVQGDPRAGLMMIRLFTREARLLGLDGPIKINYYDEAVAAARAMGVDEALATEAVAARLAEANERG